MRILLVAPEPFFEERGTPIAVDMLARSLHARGDTVDVLTTHIGRDPNYPDGIRILRIRPPFPPVGIPPGFSFRKVYCDLFIWFKLFRIGRRARYDLIHAVEESSFMAWSVNLVGGPDYVVDVDSCMADQLVNRFRVLKPLSAFLKWLENLPLRRAKGAVVVCEALADSPRRLCPGETMLLPDVSLREISNGPAENIRRIIDGDGPILMYVGNLEPYQGIDLLLESFAVLEKRCPNARLVLIGGSEPTQRRYRMFWDRLSGSSNVFFLGPRPLASLYGYLEQADAVVSPRTEGSNTPMKIYTYMDSGRPLVATSLPTHTQVVGPAEAELAEPTPEAFAEAMAKVIADPEYGRTLARNARNLVAREYNPDSFRARVNEFYTRLESCLCAT